MTITSAPSSVVDADRAPIISVVMYVLNGVHVIGEQLNALASQEVNGVWEVVVADNGSTDGTQELVRGRIASFPVELRLVGASDRRSAGHARNVGAGLARAELLAFCDSDDAVQPGWVQAAIDALNDHPLVYGARAPLTYPLDPTLPTDFDRLSPRGVRLTACNFGCRRDAFFSAGGFDVSLPPYGHEESDLVYRLRLLNIQPLPAPAMRVWFRSTTGYQNRMRKVFDQGVVEILLWRRRHRTPLTGAMVIADVLKFPQALLQLMRSETRPSLDATARNGVTRVAHAVGYFTHIRNGRLGPPIYAHDPRGPQADSAS